MTQERAVLAGGCFWGAQDLLRRYDGVLSTRVGYTGGTNAHATYRNHPGHAEAVEIIFDPTRVSYRQVLEFFFQIHDPSTRNRQGNDVGSSYRSAIFYTSDEQKRIAEDTIGPRNDRLQRIKLRRVLQVERKAFLASVGPDEVRRLALHPRVVGAGEVAAAGPLNLDHARAEVGELPRAEGRGDRVFERNNEEAVQGSCH
jgi:methionine-S-sulfoxide reductase